MAADRLLEAGHEQLKQDGCTIRQRIDELMRALGVRFPVYVLVTKCDLVQGVNRFCEHLPAKSLDQPMGIINQEMSPDVDAFLERALGTIDERLRNLRLHLLHQPEAKGADPALLLFPEEFESLKQGLAVFMGGAFHANPYQETPVLRGLFFSSGRQEGNPHSHFSKNLGLIGSEEALPNTNKGLFLHDFFAKILPRDRSLLTPTRRSIEWRGLTGNLGLTSWVILGVAICGLLSFSFVKNMKTIRDISNEFTKSTTIKGDMATDLVTLDRFRQDIQKVENRNRHWWFPRFGLNESIKVEKSLKERFCRQFRNSILIPFDKQMTGTTASISSATPDDLYAQYIVHLVRRINILKARLNEKDLQALQAQPQPAYISLLNNSAAGITLEVKKAFGALYLASLNWGADTGEINKEMSALQTQLKQLLAVKSANMEWLATWVDKQSGLPQVTLKEFWGGSISAGEDRYVNPAFTKKGKEMMDSIIKEMEAATQDTNILAARNAGFTAWYRNASFEAWHNFAANFVKGQERLRGTMEWQQAASKMATDQGPYFALLNKMSLELEPIAVDGATPAWLQQVYKFQAARAQGLAQENATISKAAEGGKKLLTTIQKNVGQEVGAQKLESQMATAKACLEYCSALAAITPALSSRSLVFQMVSQTFAEDSVTSKSPVIMANTAVAKVKSGVAGGAADPVVGQLLNGPFDFLWNFMRMESAAQLQALWEEQVLGAVTGMSSQQATAVLVGPDGLVARFVKGPAAPFLTGGMSGYRPKEVLGAKIPFDGSLFSYMEKAKKIAATSMAKQQNYTVGIKALPTDANPEAKSKPHATRLDIQCGSGSQSLLNNNYPVSKTFTWSPDICGDAVLQIEVGDVVLTKHYMGPQGFPDFLKAFYGGRRTFYVDEFPGEKKGLERLGVKSITVNYSITGSGPILQQTAAVSSGQAPRSIARCWTR